MRASSAWTVSEAANAAGEFGKFGFKLAGVLVIVFTRLKVPVIVAFLIACIVVGPIAAGLVTDPFNIPM